MSSASSKRCCRIVVHLLTYRAILLAMLSKLVLSRRMGRRRPGSRYRTDVRKRGRLRPLASHKATSIRPPSQWRLRTAIHQFIL